MVGQWKRQRPLRRFLRSRNVLAMVATAGLFLSFAGLLLLLGIGEVQIAATAHGSHDPFENWWVRAGAVFAVAGLLYGAAALVAINSQARARREFPAVQIEVMGGGNVPPEAPDAQPPRWVAFRVRSQEPTRGASLDVRLRCDLGDYVDHPMRLPALWKEPTPQEVQIVPPVRAPLDLPPMATVEGSMVFDLGYLEQHLVALPELEFVDHGSGTAVTLSSAIGSFLDTAEGRPRLPILYQSEGN